MQYEEHEAELRSANLVRQRQFSDELERRLSQTLEEHAGAQAKLAGVSAGLREEFLAAQAQARAFQNDLLNAEEEVARSAAAHEELLDSREHAEVQAKLAGASADLREELLATLFIFAILTTASDAKS